MARAKARRLKVFEARLGFYDTVVAAPSQAAALAAWGLRQNLFAEGQARQTSDAAAMAAALAHPGAPLKRAVGSAGAFEVEPAALPTVPAGPRPAAANVKAKAAPPPRPAADRSGLDAAEAALADLDAARKRQEAQLRRRQTELDAERAEAQAAYVAARKAASAALAEARRAYRKAGGD